MLKYVIEKNQEKYVRNVGSRLLNELGNTCYGNQYFVHRYFLCPTLKENVVGSFYRKLYVIDYKI